MSAARYRKKPVEVEAFRFDGTNDAAIIEWIGDNDPRAHVWQIPEGIVISTLEGSMRATPGDWVVQGTEGEFYPCKPAAFDATFEAVEPSNPTRLRNGNHVATLDRRKTPSEAPSLPGWWVVEGGGLADFVIDDPNSQWEIMP